MKRSKIISVICAYMLFWPCFGAAESVNLVTNGDFHAGSSGWSVYENGTYTSFIQDGEETYLKIACDVAGKSPWAAQGIRNLEPGALYTLSAGVRSISVSEGYGLKLEYYDEENHYITDHEERLSQTGGVWKQITYTFRVPEGATRLWLYARLFGMGEVDFDDISLTLKSGNLVTNGDFGAGSSGWSVYASGAYTSFIQDGEETYLQIACDVAGKSPWAGQGIKSITAGARYTLSAKVRSVTVSNGYGFKLEFYNSEKHIIAEHEEKLSQTNGVWTQITYTFTAPEGATYLWLYARLFGMGEVCFDDIALRVDTGEAPPFFMMPETAFFYTENSMGTVYVRQNAAAEPVAEDAILVLEVLDGEAVLGRYEAPQNAETISFPTAVLQKTGQAYKLKLSLQTEAGNILYSAEDTVYRYNRPTALQEDGTFFKNGKTVHPCIGYHCPVAAYDRLSEIGVNVVQLHAGGTVERVLEAMDAAWENGVYVLLELYIGMEPAGYPSNVENTKSMVRAAMQHEALFGYMLMDEPMANAARAGGMDEMYHYLKASYKCIRDIDPQHPTYAVECYTGGFERVGACVDVFAIDMYPTTYANMPKRIYETTKQAVQAVHGKKPVYHILQAYDISGSYEPSSADMRHMAYQAFFGGASGIGYYPIADTDSVLWENELYNGAATFAAEEQENVFAAFSGACEIIKQEETGSISSVVYRINGSVYAAAINHTGEMQTFTANLGEGDIRLIGQQMAVGFVSGYLSLSIPAYGIFSCVVHGTPAMWVSIAGTTLYNKYTPGSAQFYAVGKGRYTAWFALYQKAEPRRLIRLFSPDETAQLPEGDYILKGFLWNEDLVPKREVYSLA